MSDERYDIGVEMRDDERVISMLAARDKTIAELGASNARLIDERDRLTAELAEATRERDEAREKLAKPCGTCHPCANWSYETWSQDADHFRDTARIAIHAAAPILERQVREKIADVFRADEDLVYTTDHAVYIVLTGGPRPNRCKCGHNKDHHRDLVAGWTQRDMTTFPNAGQCQDCGCPRFDQDTSLARGRAAHEHRGAADQTGEGQHSND